MGIGKIQGLGESMKPVDEGTYEAIISALKEVDTDNGSAVVIEYTITEECEALGRKLSDFFAVGHNDPQRQQLSLQMFGRRLKALGIEVVDDEIQDEEDIPSTEVTIAVEHNTDKEGEIRANVKKVALR